MTVAFALAVLVGLGAFAGAGLALADKFFGVVEDPRLDELEAVLPGANCGGCGYPGCRAYAKALLDGEDMTLCSVGGNALVEAIAGILGKEAVSVVEKVAVVRCAGTAAQTGQKAFYDGVADCAAAALVSGGAAACPDGCLGLGSCVEACAYGAIEVRDGVAVVAPELCVSCGLCVKACPRDLIEMVPKDRRVHVLCSNKQPGKKVRAICKVGCIGCRLCSKVDPAFVVEDNLAQLRGEPGQDAGQAALVCPTGSILDSGRFSFEEFLFDSGAREKLAQMQAEYKASRKAARSSQKASSAGSKSKGSSGTDASSGGVDGGEGRRPPAAAPQGLVSAGGGGSRTERSIEEGLEEGGNASDRDSEERDR